MASHPQGRRVAEVITAGRRGSGYLVAADTVLTAAHVVRGAGRATVRFDADRPQEWSASADVVLHDPASDLAVLRLASTERRTSAEPVRYGKIDESLGELKVQAVGFPLWKLRRHADQTVSRESHHALGSVALLSNRRSDTLEITLNAAAGDQGSPWEAMSGAVVFAQGLAVGVITEHHSSEGPGRLTAVRLDRCLVRDPNLAGLLGAGALVDVPQPAAQSADPRHHGTLHAAQAAIGAVVAIVTIVVGAITYALWSATSSPERSEPSPTFAPPISRTAGAVSTAVTTMTGANGRWLTDLPPVAGADRVSRPPKTSGTLDMPCATGSEGDLRRVVEYDLLRGYTSFRAVVTRSGGIRPEAAVQVEVIVDAAVRDNAVLHSGEQADLSADITGAASLQLRLTCQEPAGKVTFADALLTSRGE
jgi:hypothetical protein